MVDAGIHVPVLTKAPELLQFVPAEYPKEAEAAGLTGSVKMQVTIAADGSVADVTVTEPIGHGFDEAAVAAVKQFKFSPAEIDNAPAAVAIEYVYNFTLNPPSPDAGAVDAGEVDAGAPPAVLTGQILARGSRSSVPGATVRCGDDPAAPEALSGEDGTFRLETVAGLCEVRVVATGYELYKTNEKLAANETTEVRYFLKPVQVGYSTTVRGERDKKEVVRRTVDRTELQKIPGTFGDPIRVLQNFPGVARAPFISGALIVRGASPDQTATLMDGIDIPLLFHLGGGPSVINSEFIDRIDFYPGGFGARYGRAVGGVVDVATRKGSSDTFHGAAKVDLLDTSVFVEAPIADGVSIAASARRSYVDALIPLALPPREDGSTLLVLPVYWDYQVRADFGKSRKDKSSNGSTYYVMAFGSDDKLTLISKGPSQPRDVSLDVHTLFHRLKGDWTYRLGNFQNVVTPYTGYDLASANFGSIKFDANIWSLGLRDDASVELNHFISVRAGTDIKFEHLVGSAELPVISGVQYVGFPGAEPKRDTQKIGRTINSFDGALYLESDLKLHPVTITPGVRATHARVHGHDMDVIDPRLWIRYQIVENTAVKGSVGLYSQTPDSSDLENPPFGNPNLKFEHAFQTSLGVEQKVTDNINFDVTGYFNRRYENVVSPGRVVTNPDGSVTREQYSNDGLGRAYGVELLLRHEVTKNFFGWLAYTLNRSEQRRVGGPDYRLTGFDQTHILTVIGSYKLPYGFEVGARFRYVTGSPHTPITHPYDLYNVDSNGYSPTRGDPNSTRLPDFHQLDVRVEKDFLFERWTLATYIDVQNVYNRANVETTFFDYRFRQEIPISGIPILPVLGVKGTW
ncbi:MAG: TonB family protein [Myxococcaceae bacterium]